MATTTVLEILVHEHCVSCGVTFGIESNHQRSLFESHKLFYCPNGHNMYYGGESNETKAKRLQEELAMKEAQINRLNTDNRTYRNEAFAQREKRLKLQKRIRAGVCPHCTRSFQNLKRHIECKHTIKKSQSA